MIMKEIMTEPTSSGILGAAIWKFGLVKTLAFTSAMIGAGIMAIFRPPKTRRELFMQGIVALGSSFMFGGMLVNTIASITGWINLNTAPIADVVQFHMAIYGFLGAISWGLFGGLSVLRDKFGSDPIKTIRSIRKD